MLTIRFVVVDRTRQEFLQRGESFYLDRIKRYARTEWIEVRPASGKHAVSPRDALAFEGEAISRRLTPREHVISLDRKGRTYDSVQLAERIGRLSLDQSSICFIIGGTLGLSQEILAKSNETFSLSSLTMTHEMARLFLLEQVYRAFTILNNEKYHK
ncbi:MAG: 23S rRNA (pseudouridine(1915)-N(3))-methyltransferase RlmH [Desulfobacteraceae bacterium]|jgi:23S rRNA (pseudouridine1915-N3)-methyltransferase|nr:MAG: 23S rRNA (pseudouridine(1915)-N(3))-methyltransferase RlmH [Desulfobacteraceae bacterium]